MAEMLVLSTRSGNSDGFIRLSQELAAAFARGQDLGPRAPHIQAGVERLWALGRELEFAVRDLKALMNELDLQDRAEYFQPSLVIIQELADKVKAFQPLIAKPLSV